MIASLRNVSRRRFRHWMSGTVCVTLNGKDVTRSCFYADTRAGVVRLYRRDSLGRVYVEPPFHRAATEELHGSVRVYRRDHRKHPRPSRKITA